MLPWDILSVVWLVFVSLVGWSLSVGCTCAVDIAPASSYISSRLQSVTRTPTMAPFYVFSVFVACKLGALDLGVIPDDVWTCSVQRVAYILAWLCDGSHLQCSVLHLAALLYTTVLGKGKVGAARGLSVGVLGEVVEWWPIPWVCS